MRNNVVGATLAVARGHAGTLVAGRGVPPPLWRDWGLAQWTRGPHRQPPRGRSAAATSPIGGGKDEVRIRPGRCGTDLLPHLSQATSSPAGGGTAGRRGRRPLRRGRATTRVAPTAGGMVRRNGRSAKGKGKILRLRRKRLREAMTGAGCRGRRPRRPGVLRWRGSAGGR